MLSERKTGIRLKIKYKNSTILVWVWSNPGINCPRKLWSLYFQKCSRRDKHNTEWAALADPVLRQDVGLHDLQRSFPLSNTLWFFMFLKFVTSLNFHWSFNALLRWICSSCAYFSDSFCPVNGSLNEFILLPEQMSVSLKTRFAV